MASEVVDAGTAGASRARPSRRRPARSDDQLPYDEDELQRFFTLDPEDLAFVGGTRSERNLSRDTGVSTAGEN